MSLFAFSLYGFVTRTCTLTFVPALSSSTSVCPPDKGKKKRKGKEKKKSNKTEHLLPLGSILPVVSYPNWVSLWASSIRPALTQRHYSVRARVTLRRRRRLQILCFFHQTNCSCLSLFPAGHSIGWHCLTRIFHGLLIVWPASLASTLTTPPGKRTFILDGRAAI